MAPPSDSAVAVSCIRQTIDVCRDIWWCPVTAEAKQRERISIDSSSRNIRPFRDLINSEADKSPMFNPGQGGRKNYAYLKLVNSPFSLVSP
jgi:hypothetical protein